MTDSQPTSDQAVENVLLRGNLKLALLALNRFVEGQRGKADAKGMVTVKVSQEALDKAVEAIKLGNARLQDRGLER